MLWSQKLKQIKIKYCSTKLPDWSKTGDCQNLNEMILFINKVIRDLHEMILYRNNVIWNSTIRKCAFDIIVD